MKCTPGFMYDEEGVLVSLCLQPDDREIELVIVRTQRSITGSNSHCKYTDPKSQKYGYAQYLHDIACGIEQCYGSEEVKNVVQTSS